MSIIGDGIGALVNTEPWTVDALCAQVDVGDLFFPDKGANPRQAKQVCQACPVTAQCLDYAMATRDNYGIYGGLTPRERMRLRRTA